MDEFIEDLKSGQIQFRDKWQFELKSEFFTSPAREENVYTQEFYFFIPNSLQINSSTFSKEEFYRDLTNFIRYKSPICTLDEIPYENDPNSPFIKLNLLAKEPVSKERDEAIELELKLFGNIFKSALRASTTSILNSEADLEILLEKLVKNIQAIRKTYDTLSTHLLEKSTSEDLHTSITYLDEFISNTVDYYFTGILENLRKNKRLSQRLDDALCQIVLFEKKRRETFYSYILHSEEQSERDEEILYRSGLLKKYVMDVLLLPIQRASIQDLYGNFISSISAGIAALVYILLFIWQGQWFIINSAPFIILTVGAYVLKDQLKNGLKSLSYQRALKWFSDYNTQILSADEKSVIGTLKESFTFVNPKNLPKEIAKMRKEEFHSMIETFERPEQVIYFKRQVTIKGYQAEKRLQALSVVLRYNIRPFIEKASEPYHSYVTLDTETKALLKRRLPKVYHLNIIMKNTYLSEKGIKTSEITKFRLVVDKNGIKHIIQGRDL